MLKLQTVKQVGGCKWASFVFVTSKTFWVSLARVKKEMDLISVSIRKVEVKMHFKAKIRIYNVQDFQPLK